MVRATFTEVAGAVTVVSVALTAVKVIATMVRAAFTEVAVAVTMVSMALTTVKVVATVVRAIFTEVAVALTMVRVALTAVKVVATVVRVTFTEVAVAVTMVRMALTAVKVVATVVRATFTEVIDSFQNILQQTTKEKGAVDSSSMPFTIAQIREALGRHQPQLLEQGQEDTRASVALVLAGLGNELSLCAIRRAEHPLDPWSGHMALPGGRCDPDDCHPRAAAERETLEEVGLSLGELHWLGALSEVQVRIGGTSRKMILSPFIYHLGEELAPFTPNHEVAEVFWIPLSHLWDPGNASSLEWESHGKRLLYPAIRYQGHAIWGLTFRVLTLFSDVLDSPLPHLEEIPGLGR